MTGQTTPSLSRVAIASDGRIKANFSDNTVLLLSPGGSNFAHRDAKGCVVRQTSQFAVGSYLDALGIVQEFRSMHLDIPFMCKAVRRRQQESSFFTGYPISSVRWPKHLQEAEQQRLIEHLPGGRISVRSEGGSVRLTLDANRCRFAVCYPCLVSVHCDEKGRTQHEFIWQTQLFCTADFPERWFPALQLACAAVEDPGALLLPNDFSTSLASRTTELPKAAGEFTEAPCQYDDNPWWCEPTATALPEGMLIQLEWTPTALFQFLPGAREVIAWIHEDESCLISTQGGQFFQHMHGEGMEPLVYAVNAVPDHVRSADKQKRYALAPIVRHAAHFRDSAARMLSTLLDASAPERSAAESAGASAPSPASSLQVICNEVHEEQNVPGYGRFTAYADGRVRIFYSDRTILAMDAQHQHCSLLLRDGTKAEVHVSAPIGVEGYVKAAAEFAAWAFRTPEQRQVLAEQQRQVEGMQASNACMAQVYDWLLHGQLPASDDSTISSASMQGEEAWLLLPSAASASQDGRLPRRPLPEADAPTAATPGASAARLPLPQVEPHDRACSSGSGGGSSAEQAGGWVPSAAPRQAGDLAGSVPDLEHLDPGQRQSVVDAWLLRNAAVYEKLASL